MKISVITVNYNNCPGLLLTLKSVFNQKSDARYELEYIVIDGGSTDGSAYLLQKYDSKIYSWVSEPDRGVYHAMNKGIVKSSGSYLIFLNSGDYLINDNILALYCDYIEDYKGIDIYYGDTMINYLDAVSRLRHRHPDKIDLAFLRKDNINHQASLICKSLFNEFGLYPEHYHLASDYWLYLLAFIKGKKYKYINQPLVFYDIAGMSAANSFKSYSSEKKTIWNEIFCEKDNLIILTNSFDSLVAENDILKKNNSYKIVKIAIWVNEKLRGIKNKIRM